MLCNRQIKLKESDESVTLGVECQNVLMFYDKNDMVNFEPGEYTRICFFQLVTHYRRLECETFLSLFLV